LINAKSFQTNHDVYKGGLSDYLTNEINRNITLNYKIEKRVNKFFKNDDNRTFEKLDKIIRIFEISDLLKNKRPQYKSLFFRLTSVL